MAARACMLRTVRGYRMPFRQFLTVKTLTTMPAVASARWSMELLSP